MTSRHRTWGWLALACIPQVAYVALLGYREHGEIAIALFVTATIGWAGAVRELRTDPSRVSLRALVAVIAAMCVAMVAFPTRASNDVYSYAMYGRIVSEYSSNPYTALPDEFRDDPIFSSVGGKWVHTPSRYGPLFTVVSVAGTAALPGERLPLRLFFQGLTACGVIGLLVLVWRRWRSPTALVFVALHPLMMVSVLNGAHNDIFVALGAFAFVWLLDRNRLVWAGFALAAAALVKATALLAVAAAVVWLVSRRRVRDAAIVGAVAVSTTVLGTLTIPGGAAAIRSASDINLDASVWYPFLLFATRGNSFPVHGLNWSIHEVEQFVKTPALVAVVLALVVAAWRASRAATPSLDLAVALGLATFSVFAAWVMPWYLVWCLPLLGLTSGRVRTTMAVHATLLLSVAHLHSIPHERLDVSSWLLLIALPLAVVPAYGLALWADTRRVGVAA